MKIIYYSIDEANCDDPADAANFPIKFMNTLNPSGMPPHAVAKLKMNTIVILLRNLEIHLLVTDLRQNIIFAKILTGSGKEFIPAYYKLISKKFNLINNNDQ